MIPEVKNGKPKRKIGKKVIQKSQERMKKITNDRKRKKDEERFS